MPKVLLLCVFYVTGYTKLFYSQILGSNDATTNEFKKKNCKYNCKKKETSTQIF